MPLDLEELSLRSVELARRQAITRPPRACNVCNARPPHFKAEVADAPLAFFRYHSSTVHVGYPNNKRRSPHMHAFSNFKFNGVFGLSGFSHSGLPFLESLVC